MIGKMSVLASALRSPGCGYERRQDSYFFARSIRCTGVEAQRTKVSFLLKLETECRPRIGSGLLLRRISLDNRVGSSQ